MGYNCDIVMEGGSFHVDGEGMCACVCMRVRICVHVACIGVVCALTRTFVRYTYHN